MGYSGDEKIQHIRCTEQGNSVTVQCLRNSFVEDNSHAAYSYYYCSTTDEKTVRIRMDVPRGDRS